MDTTFLLTQVLNGLTYGALLFLVSSGFTITYGLMRIVNLAHGGFYLIGGYVGLTTTSITHSFWLGLLAGAAAVVVLGLVTERVLLRPIRGQPLSEVLLTVGLSIVLADIALAGWGGSPETIDAPDQLSGAASIGSFFYPKLRLAIVAAAIVIGVALFLLQHRTRIGAMVRAGVDDREVVAALGVNIERVFSSVFMVGSAFAGISGVLGGALLGLAPGADTQILLSALVVVIIGGVGSLPGAVVGSAVVGLVDAFGKAYVPDLSYFTLFAPMALVLVFWPRGLLGRA